MPSIVDIILAVIGILIIICAAFTRVPQMTKVIKAKSGAGLSHIGMLMELSAYKFALAYPLSQGFPVTAYGEFALLVLGTAIVYVLVLYYGEYYALIVVFVCLLSAASILLYGILGTKVLATLQAVACILSTSGKLVQVYKNYRQQHTGQLSKIMMWMLWAMGFVRIFTATYETGDWIIVTNYVSMTIANSILIFQIYYYRKATAKFREAEAELSPFVVEVKARRGESIDKSKESKEGKEGEEKEGK